MDPSDGVGSVSCPKCGTSVAADEKFCTSCGVGIAVGPAGTIAQDPLPTVVSLPANGHLGRARKWLLGVSIMTLISGFVFFGIQKQDIEKQIREAEVAVAGMDPVERDRLMVQEVGMTFQEAIDHDRGMVNMLLAVNIGLSVIYLGLWFWAKKNAYAAAVVALLLFLTVIIVGAVLEPKSLAQGMIMKVLFVVALSRAIKAGSDERKLLGAT
jgi:hypothetical protein